MNKVSHIIKVILVSLINLYQKTLSFDHSPLRVFYPHGFCRFTPTCSQYGKEAIEKHGPIKGIILGTWRVIRCNPWSKGGHDPVK
jgi:uncharacterized protein